MTGDDRDLHFRERRVIGKGGHCRQLVQQRTRRCSPSRDEIIAWYGLEPRTELVEIACPVADVIEAGFVEVIRRTPGESDIIEGGVEKPCQSRVIEKTLLVYKSGVSRP